MVGADARPAVFTGDAVSEPDGLRRLAPGLLRPQQVEMRRVVQRAVVERVGREDAADDDQGGAAKPCRAAAKSRLSKWLEIGSSFARVKWCDIDGILLTESSRGGARGRRP